MDYLNIEKEKILPVVTELNVLLANYQVYYQKLRNFHWNILGKNFFDLHSKFKEMYHDTRIKIDEVAERIITLKYHPISKLSDYLEVSKIKESSPLLSDKEMVENIIGDHKILLEQLGKVINRAEKATDQGTVDLIRPYVRRLEKSTWMLNTWSKDTKKEMNTTFVE
ncbi:DNA starvation/stationary phase protection protein [Polaribacter litorisediminis]|uniref:Dps family protein n=1 Tax=Polaribacter litorisediminis TaxID=1908341 RepID=UPI001CBD006C|nr:DNA starvation/stationary phase protection protein [Polaribacter litorisediminis]UAM99540.1 DNA starvation/stationary phase protection protein [Polaribacter litorisediminis]